MTPNQETYLAKRQIFIDGRIDEAMEKYVIESILLLNARNSQEVITIFLNSRGGEVHPNKHIIDVVQNSEAPIHCIVIGRAYSSAFNILQVCTVRIAYQHADMMCHASDMAGVRVDDKKARRRMEKELEKTYKEFIEYLSIRSGQPIERWQKWSLKQEYFNGRQAKKLGIVDKVVLPKKDFPKPKTE